MTASLIVSGAGDGRMAMLAPKTHFEQVPLEMVKEIAETKRRKMTKQDRGTRKKNSDGIILEANTANGGAGKS